MGKPAEIWNLIGGDPNAANIVSLWDTFNNQRQEKIKEWKELRNYVFATDTMTTSNSDLPWKNKTTLPKLCQIRDNLHANYLSALFPNDDWLRWEAYTKDSAMLEKKKAITAYMSNKTRTGQYRKEMSKLLYDYIDYGNAFVTTEFVADFKTIAGEERIPDFIGPKSVRISPLDIVFNPTAKSFEDSFKIIRSIKTIGELQQQATDEPDNAYLHAALKKRDIIISQLGSFSKEDTDKAQGFTADGFGNIHEYYMSGFVEILEFWGDYHDPQTGKGDRDRVITIMDRASVLRNDAIPSWTGGAPIRHVGWRLRPDNLWAMGPLDNLVGMQYRIDHLENLTADAMDIAVQPPLKIVGEVEEFDYGPLEEIHIDVGGDVVELGKNAQWVIAAENNIGLLEQKMEQFAGAPSEAMGIRSPGEKTAFEVQQLQNASGRIFQEKITTFETELLEPNLNDMLETSRRNLDITDTIRVMDDDLGVQEFLSVTRDNITASGKIRPVGARHFAAQAQLLQNLTGVFSSPIGQMIMPHTSTKQLAKVVEDVLGLERFSLFRENVAVSEQQETARQVNQAEEDLEVEATVEGPPA